MEKRLTRKGRPEAKVEAGLNLESFVELQVGGDDDLDYILISMKMVR